MKCRSAGFLVFLSIFLLLGGVSSAALVTVDLVQNPDPSGWPAGNYAYGAGTLSYETYATSFTGSFTVSGLHAGTVYQVKLEGQPGADMAGNINIGSVGRWFLPGTGNIASDADALALIAGGQPVLGYLLFDSFTATSGTQIIDFYADWSYHTAGVNQRGSIVMPDGSYTATFMLSEDPSPYGSPLLRRDITFEVGVAPVPEPGTMMLLGSGLVGLAGWGRKKLRK